MRATPVFREKRVVVSQVTGQLAIAELKIWVVPRTKEYPEGRRYSLFLVAEGHTIVGIDNHRPKGPHLHLRNREMPYVFQDEEKLVEDFWELTRKAGYKP